MYYDQIIHINIVLLAYAHALPDIMYNITGMRLKRSKAFGYDSCFIVS